ncbi:MAG: pyrrolo-quinoline quinone [Planctomycetota bacterium]|nr:MAG: pyrrolo-quinoline quinone [Planctomycetota bacterium]
MTFRTTLLLLLALASLAIAAVPAAAEDWPQFRGPDGQGHAATTSLPTTWSETQNVRWKTPIAGLGWSSPVVVGSQVWLTTAISEQGSLRAVCVDRDSGSVVHDVEVFHQDDLGRIASKNSHASPTPVVDGRHVFVHYGAHGTACLTTDGQVVWQTQLKYDHRHGPGGSPVLWNDLLIVACDAPDEQYLVALDKRTGRVRWRADHQGDQAYSTPTLVDMGGAEQLVTSRGNAAIAFAPATGQELWRCRYTGHSVVPRPVAAGGLVFCCTGYWNPSLLAIRLGGSGDVTDSHIAYSIRRGVPHNPSPLVSDGRLYLVSDMGVLTCVHASTGKELWRERLAGNFSASPTAADGKIYLVAEDATTYVVRGGDHFDLLATNHLDGQALASPAFVGGAIYFRTDTHLYRLELGSTPQPVVRASATAPVAAPLRPTGPKKPVSLRR